MADKLNTAYATVSRAKAIAEEVVAESGGGTTIIPNPEEADPTDALWGVTIGDTTYIVTSPCVIADIVDGAEEGEFEIDMVFWDWALIQELQDRGWSLAIAYNGIVIPQAFTHSLEFSLCSPDADADNNPIINNYWFTLDYDEGNEEWSVQGQIDTISAGGSSSDNIVELDYENGAYIFNGTIDDLLNPCKNTLVIIGSSESSLINRQLERNGKISTENEDGASYSCVYVEGGAVYIVQADITANSQHFSIFVNKAKLMDIPEQE